MTIELILHIGMGKTGTSSIQAALQNSAKELAAGGATYLGMWVDFVDHAYHHHPGLLKFLAGTDAEIEARADLLADRIEARAAESGHQRFVLSNESLFTEFEGLSRLIRRLQQRMSVRLIAYLRPPQSWLPSAYAQWMLFHKPRGPLLAFSARARELVQSYAPTRQWADHFGAIMDFRLHDPKRDVVEDFATATGLSLRVGQARVQERVDNAELILRAMFNSRFADTVRPERFNAIILKPGKPVLSLDKFVNEAFDRSEINQIIAENSDVFEFVRDNLGMDFAAAGPAKAERVDPDDLRRRVNDYLIEIVLRQAIQLRRLEMRLDELSPEKPAQAD